MANQDKEYYRAYREKNKERISENRRKWYQENKMWMNVYHRRWYHLTKDNRNAYLRSYYRSRIDHFRKQSSENNQKRRTAIMNLLGGPVCRKCSFNDIRALQIDHVNGGGSRLRRTSSHAWSYKFWKTELKERPQAYQILCANCNWIKRYENREMDRCRI